MDNPTGIRNCMCCAKELPVDLEGIQNNIHHVPYRRAGDVVLVHGGGEIHISFGYGSVFDTDNLSAFICDDCIVGFVNNAKAKFVYDSPISEGSRFTNIEPGDYFERRREQMIRDGFKFASFEDLESI